MTLFFKILKIIAQMRAGMVKPTVDVNIDFVDVDSNVVEDDSLEGE